MSAHRHPRQHAPALQLAVTLFGAIVIFCVTAAAVITVHMFVTEPDGEFERNFWLGFACLVAVAVVISVYLYLSRRRDPFAYMDAGRDTDNPEGYTRALKQASPSEKRITQHLRLIGHLLPHQNKSERTAAKLAERVRRAVVIRRAGEAQPAPALAPLPAAPVRWEPRVTQAPSTDTSADAGMAETDRAARLAEAWLASPLPGDGAAAETGAIYPDWNPDDSGIIRAIQGEPA